MTINEIIERFMIHDVSIQESSCGRVESWLPGMLDADALVYRVGRSAKSPYSIVELTGEDEGIVIYRFNTSFTCRVFEKAEIESHDADTDPSEIDAICEVSAIYDADYVVKDSSGLKDEFDDESLGSFARHNVPYHVWPFFREHLHSMLSKMQVQPIILHTLRVPPSHQRKRDK